MEGDGAFVQDEDGVVEFDVGEGVGDGDDGASVFSGEVVEEVNDFAFGAGVEATGDFVAEEEFGAGDQFHGEAEAAFLSAGEDLHLSVGDGGEAGFLEDAIDAGVEVFDVLRLDAEASGGLQRLVHREWVIGDGELRDISDFPRFEVAFFGEVASFPPEGAFGFRVEAGDGLEEGCFAAAGGADDGHEMAPGDGDGHLINQVERFAVFLNGETDVLKFEHEGLRLGVVNANIRTAQGASSCEKKWATGGGDEKT